MKLQMVTVGMEWHKTYGISSLNVTIIQSPDLNQDGFSLNCDDVFTIG